MAVGPGFDLTQSVCLQPRQSLLNVAARAGEASQDFIVCIESESDLDRDFKVCCTKLSKPVMIANVYFVLCYWFLSSFKQVVCVSFANFFTDESCNVKHLR